MPPQTPNDMSQPAPDLPQPPAVVPDQGTLPAQPITEAPVAGAPAVDPASVLQEAQQAFNDVASTEPASVEPSIGQPVESPADVHDLPSSEPTDAAQPSVTDPVATEPAMPTDPVQPVMTEAPAPPPAEATPAAPTEPVQPPEDTPQPPVDTPPASPPNIVVG